MIRALVLLLALILPLAAGAVQPDEILDDPVLEARARSISAGLRCPVCRNESIDDSHADLARDLRLLVRERLVAGDTDAQVTRFIVERYGEYVLLNPPARGSTWILWLAGPGLLLLGLGLVVSYLRRRARAPEAETGLNAEEAARLAEIMEDDGQR
ncbi:cytochrome c-type biogenesis protein CcmH [Rhodophyticola sp. CCM32]|uniref:cytochrome c-type biogenesis protein n=1 Tax=Rhodophyticola sp. CCM32 TaxID=2916397 RepID=UPI00107F5D4F|nr:cytochrome c-type biogenesis protein [Rhodophyticola sp. CCM32]QBY00299.1 cytochrome c-type biogenesis protein CcmH [Rhodophyticola sp. CCM32]